MRITSEEQLLSEELRRQIIKEEIYGEENRERKAQMLRRHEIMKGKSKKWVMFGIEQEGFKTITVEQMRSRASNISVGRKIVNKLSQTYTGGVERKLGEPVKTGDSVVPNPNQMALDTLYDLLDMNTMMKKTDRFRTGFRTCLAGVVPILNMMESRKTGKKLFDLKMQVLAPWKFDVIEDPYDPTKPLAVIISEFTDRMYFKQMESNADGAQGIRRFSLSDYLSDGKDQMIADNPEDKEANPNDRRFIWWTNGYHFTTDMRGRIIADSSPGDLKNPIGELPWETFATDQDGAFWADGGDDIFETDIAVNKMLTDALFIQFIQGWGQLVIDAVNVPKRLQGGPDNAWIFERQPGETTGANVFFASSNPPIGNWLESIRMLLALCLSTNDLSPRAVAASLDVQNAASGVVLMVENSEMSPNIKDSQAYFQDKEPCLLEKIVKWHSTYKKNGWLTEEFAKVNPITSTDLLLKFHEFKAPISDKETLEIMQMEKDLGIVTTIDLIKKANPDLSDEDARKKAEEIYEEKKKMSEFISDTAKKMQSGGIKNGNNEEPPPSDNNPPPAPGQKNDQQQEAA